MSYVFRTVKLLQRMVSLKMAQASRLFPAPTTENVYLPSHLNKEVGSMQQSPLLGQVPWLLLSNKLLFLQPFVEEKPRTSKVGWLVVL